MIAERVEHDRGVLASFDDLVEVADGPLPHRSSQRTIDPDRVAALKEVAPDQIRRREVVVA